MIYPNKLKNWDFADAEHARFDPEKTGPLLTIGAAFSESKIACSAKVKTNSSACLGIQGDLPLKDSQKDAFLVSATFHVLFLLFLIAQGFFASQKHVVPKKLVVHSVVLKPHCTEKPPSKVLPSPPQQEVACASEPLAPKEASSPQEKLAPEPIAEPSSTKEEEVVAAKEEAPPKQAKATAKTLVPAKQVAKKQPAKTKTQAASKQPIQPTASKKQSPSAPSYDKRLVAEALSRLDKSAKATQGSAGKGSSGKKYTDKISRVGAVGALHTDTGLAAFDTKEEGAEFSPTSAEGCYIADLIRRLQLNIRLPEPGEIRIKLTLKKGGQVSSVTVVSCKSAKMKSVLVEKLKKVHFSSFGQSFRGEEEHTFLLKLSNDLVWSCS